MSRHVIDVEPDDLELIAAALETVAVQRRVAAERASAEVGRAKVAGEDVRARSVRIVEVLGEAGRLQDAAVAVRQASELAPAIDLATFDPAAALGEPPSEPQQPAAAPRAPRRPRRAASAAQGAQGAQVPAGASQALTEALAGAEDAAALAEDDGQVLV